MELPVRFSSLVRSGLRFRRTFELAKQRAVGEEDWYPYDCFTNLFPIEQLRRNAGLSLADLTGTSPSSISERPTARSLFCSNPSAIASMPAITPVPT